MKLFESMSALTPEQRKISDTVTGTSVALAAILAVASMPLPAQAQRMTGGGYGIPTNPSRIEPAPAPRPAPPAPPRPGGGGSEIHRSTDPSGPFLPVIATDYPYCNNPSPFVHKNGTLYLACKWSLHSAPRPEGPWKTVHAQLGPPSSATRHLE